MSRHLMAKMRNHRTSAFDWRETTPPHRGNRTWRADLENGHSLYLMEKNPSLPEEERPYFASIWHPGKDSGVDWHPSETVLDHGHSDSELKGFGNAQAALEQAYKQMFPIGADTGPHDSGVDYSDLNKFMGEL